MSNSESCEPDRMLERNRRDEHVIMAIYLCDTSNYMSEMSRIGDVSDLKVHE